MSMLLLPCDVSKMTSGDTPISWPILLIETISQSVSGVYVVVTVRVESGSHVCQCFSTALVESMMVPSISKRKPWKVARTGGAE